jgi:hypothetical protein
VQARKTILIHEAAALIERIRDIAQAGVEDALVDPATLTAAVTSGLLDAPQLINNKFAQGKARTRIINGASIAVDQNGTPIQL